MIEETDSPLEEQAEGEGAADEESFESRSARMLEEAVEYDETFLTPARTKATEYYKGEKFGNEQDGRSQVVSTDVRDTVTAMMPSLMRVFFGPERAVEFKPRGPEDIDLAEQQNNMTYYPCPSGGDLAGWRCSCE